MKTTLMSLIYLEFELLCHLPDIVFLAGLVDREIIFSLVLTGVERIHH